MVLLFHLTTFLSAFLLFVIQPVMAKAMLPALGGSAVVWGTCMVTFQGLLFLGYLVSHAILTHWSVKRYVAVHVPLVLSAAVIMSTFGVIETDTGPLPWWPVLRCSLLAVGFPFFLLSFSTPLLQRWLAEKQTDPYPLFSTSNAGSILALLAYPFLIEPHMALSHQTTLWKWGLFLMSGFLATLWWLSRAWPSSCQAPADSSKPFGNAVPVFVASAGGTALLLSVTNAITFDISSAPLLWVLPLTLYLASFVVVFKKRPWLNPRLARAGMPWWISAGLTLFLMGRYQVGFDGLAATIAQLAVVGFGCWLAHARIAELKPKREHALTGYYVAMSAGGLTGTLVVSWIIPVLANQFIEYPLAIALLAGGLSSLSIKSHLRPLVVSTLITAGLTLGTVWLVRSQGDPVLGFAAVAGLLMLLSLARKEVAWWTGIALAVCLVVGPSKDLLWQSKNSKHYRNHYGIYEVSESNDRLHLTHGTTNHGIQNLAPAKRGIPSYYHRGGPAGELLGALPSQRRHFGMIGLGAGALVTYTRPGDLFEVFELDPLNITLATTQFTYLSDKEAEGVEVRLHQGDGRLLLEEHSDLDVLILDAFSSGSIPMHLLTTEALSAYLKTVKVDGFILMHISNRTLNLRPLIASTMKSLSGTAYFKDSDSLPDQALKSSDWALLSPTPTVAQALAESLNWLPYQGDQPLPKPWTDETSNLLSVWRR